MCLHIYENETDEFRKNHEDDETIKVWKVYYTHGSYLTSVFRRQHIGDPGVVQSNRQHDTINNDDDAKMCGPQHWAILRGIHVYTTRKKAVWNCDWRRVVVCCHAKMSNFIAYNYVNKEAVFMEVSISPRNFRRATKGK